MGRPGPNRHYLPIEQRVRAYNEALRLRRQGLSYRNIVERIQRVDKIRLTTSHVDYWVRGVKSPLRTLNKFTANPTSELAGVIGGMLSDGDRHLYKTQKGSYAYEIRLRVKDREYAEAFGYDLAKVLGREKPCKPHRNRSDQRWTAKACSVLLFKHLDKHWHGLRSDIEANEVCVARFLRRFFDGEACINGKALKLFNTDKELLIYIQQLLRLYFGVEATGPRLTSKAGHCFQDPRNGKTYKAKKTVYYVRIRAESLPRFHRYIGFTISRKQRRLVEAIQK